MDQESSRYVFEDVARGTLGSAAAQAVHRPEPPEAQRDVPQLQRPRHGIPESRPVVIRGRRSHMEQRWVQGEVLLREGDPPARTATLRIPTRA